MIRKQLTLNLITKCKYFTKRDCSLTRSHMAAFDIWLNTKHRLGKEQIQLLMYFVKFKYSVTYTSAVFKITAFFGVRYVLGTVFLLTPFF
jgi:hypothetical protein